MEWKEALDLEGLWTNEKHLKFLNSIEAMFVHTVLENGGLTYTTAFHLPLDRYLPDRSDSTSDLQIHKNSKRKRVYFPGGVDVGMKKSNKRRPRQPCDESEDHNDCYDQVVPQLGNMKADKIESSDVEVEVAVAPTDEEIQSHRKTS
ncbi:uncharacterized protein LOC122081520 [Macadamia integrifolia]|uniref:uncharacterized protein LOC122081520 n=1 Tax=Macadamia integrifolia TaxID=60698 RepID=UPI001C4E9DD3|nr:uncharacterized protein LOC122081520 [Macadamia integrifolia]